MEIRIGTRASPLALKQAAEAIDLLKQRYPQAHFSIVTIDTSGDKNKLTPISEVEGSDFFTREIDEALLAGEIDFAVHSSKDLPRVIPKGLAIVMETLSISNFDCLVSRDNIKFMDLPRFSRVGSSSQRRKNEIRRLRKDLKIIDIRGNIQERLALVDEAKIDALIIAHAALIRLGLEHRITEVFPLDVFRTHPKQGCISILARKIRRSNEDIIRQELWRIVCLNLILDIYLKFILLR
ncbi:MAG: hydroxymethylbilane synthase [Candidatus Omnitrophota bacterium]